MADIETASVIQVLILIFFRIKIYLRTWSSRRLYIYFCQMPPTFLAQSRQSARLFLQSSELVLPHPFEPPAKVLPSQLGQEVGYTLARGRGDGGVPIPTRDQTLWYYICTLCFLGSFDGMGRYLCLVLKLCHIE
jgi:hypothetical protein